MTVRRGRLNDQQEKEVAAIVETLEVTLSDENVAIVTLALSDLLMEILPARGEEGVKILEHMALELKEQLS
jgi:hypothetical protein